MTETTVTISIILRGKRVELAQAISNHSLEEGITALLKTAVTLEDQFVIPGPPVTMKTLEAENAPEWAKSAMSALEEE